jgi:hypothetical protein
MPSRKATPQEKIRRAFRNKTGARLTFEDIENLLAFYETRKCIYPIDRAYYEDQRHNPKAESKPEADQ